MNVSADQLQFCLSQAAIITQAYELNEFPSGEARRSTDGLLRTCKQAFGAEIVVLELPLNGNDGVQGMSILSPKKVEIVLAQDLNYCWKRYVLCKELFHLALDVKADFRNIDLAAQVEGITLAFPDDNSKPTPAVAAEFLAEVGAVELLFPFKQRRVVVEKGNPNFAEVAERFKLPQLMVERFLSKSYMENLGPYCK